MMIFLAAIPRAPPPAPPPAPGESDPALPPRRPLMLSMPAMVSVVETKIFSGLAPVAVIVAPEGTVSEL